MKYFQMKYKGYWKAAEELWERQDNLNVPHISLHSSFSGMDGSVWTPDAIGEASFRKVLQDLNIAFTESDQQEVRTWLDAFTQTSTRTIDNPLSHEKD